MSYFDYFGGDSGGGIDGFLGSGTYSSPGQYSSAISNAASAAPSAASGVASGAGSLVGGAGSLLTGKNLATLGGAGLGLIGNTIAANTVADGNANSLAFLSSQDAQARNDLLASKASANESLQPAVDAGVPARQVLQSAMTTSPATLTPMQQIGLSDLTRQETNNLSVAGMRGAGYGGQAVLGDATQRYIAGAQNTNQARSDAAAGTLNSQGFTASQGQANADLGTGSNTANINVGEGAAGASLGQSTAGTDASATLADANLASSGLGSVGAALDQQQKAADPYANFSSPGG